MPFLLGPTLPWLPIRFPLLISTQKEKQSGAITNRIWVPQWKSSWTNKIGMALSAILPWRGDKTEIRVEMQTTHSGSTSRKDHEKGDQNGTWIHLRSWVSRYITLPVGLSLPLSPKMDQRRVGTSHRFLEGSICEWYIESTAGWTGLGSLKSEIN